MLPWLIMTSTETVSESAAAVSDDPKPGRHVVMAVTCIALLMASVDQTSVATAVASLQTELDAPVTWVMWTITAYALGQIVAMPLAGRLSDQFGRKRIFLGAVMLFTIASLLCATSTNIYMLIVFRTLQALGGGAFMPSAVGIVSDAFGRNRDRAIGLFTSVLPIGGLIGPVVGALMVTFWSWRGIFLINIPLGIIVLVLGLWVLPESTRSSRGRLDLLGIGLFVLGMVGVMVALTNLGSGGASPAGFAVPLALGGVFLGLFVWRSAAASDPFVPLRLLVRREFAVLNIVNLLSGAATIGFGSIMALYAVDRYGLSILQAGAMLTARAIGTIAVAGVAALAIRRTGYRWPMRIGFVLTAMGFAGVAIPPPAAIPVIVWLGASAVVVGIGMGISIPSNNNAGLDILPRDIAAIAGIRGMARQTGGIIGVSVIAAISAGSGDPAATQAWAFLIFGGILLALLPLISFVPERRGSW